MAFEDCVLMIPERVSKGEKERERKENWGATEGTRVTAKGGYTEMSTTEMEGERDKMRA